AHVRDRGYAAARLTESAARIRQLLSNVESEGIGERAHSTLRQLMAELDIRSELVDELRPGESFPVNAMNVPVFDANARPVLNLTLHLVRTEMTFEEPDSLAQAVIAVASKV